MTIFFLQFPTILTDENSLHKVAAYSENVGVVFAGMPPDFRVVLNKGRKAAVK